MGFPPLSLGLQKKKRGGERDVREEEKMGGGPEIKNERGKDHTRQVVEAPCSCSWGRRWARPARASGGERGDQL
jgi:hypothetical protein